VLYGYQTLTLIPDTGSPVAVDVASQDLYQRTDEMSVRGDGTEALDGRTHVLEALVVDAAALATIERWEREGVQVRGFAHGLEASLVWDEPCRVRVVPEGQQKAGRHRAKVRLFSAIRDAAIEGPAVNLLSGRFAPFLWGHETQDYADAPYVYTSDWVTVPGGVAVCASVDVTQAAPRQGGELRLWLDAPGVSTSEVLSSEEVGQRSGIASVPWTPLVAGRARIRIVSTGGGAAGSYDSLRTPSLRVATSIMSTPITTPVAY